MRLLHTAAKTGTSFDDPNLVSYAGLVPAVRLVENVGLEDWSLRTYGWPLRSARTRG
jgi:hypothetical protein